MIVLAMHAGAFVMHQLLLRRVADLTGVDAQPELLLELLRRDPELAARWLRQAYLVVALDDLAIACSISGQPHLAHPLGGFDGGLDEQVHILRALTRRVRSTGPELVRLNPRPPRPAL